MSEFKPKRAKRYKPNENRNKTFKPKSFNIAKQKTTERGYDRDWRNYSYRFLHHNKYCYVCSKQSEVVDHRVPWKVDKDKLFWNIQNYLPLCKKCHNTVTSNFDRQNPPDIEGKHNWILKRRELNGVEIRVKPVSFKKGSGLGKAKG